MENQRPAKKEMLVPKAGRDASKVEQIGPLAVVLQLDLVSLWSIQQILRTLVGLVLDVASISQLGLVSRQHYEWVTLVASARAAKKGLFYLLAPWPALGTELDGSALLSPNFDSGRA